MLQSSAAEVGGGPGDDNEISINVRMPMSLSSALSTEPIEVIVLDEDVFVVVVDVAPLSPLPFVKQIDFVTSCCCLLLVAPEDLLDDGIIEIDLFNSRSLLCCTGGRCVEKPGTAASRRSAETSVLRPSSVVVETTS